VPRQELFLEQNVGDKQIKVIKTYDRSYAHEVFRSMDDQATSALAAALDISENYEPADIPDQNGSEYEDFLWEELCTAAREDVRLDPDLYSFFVVTETVAGKTEDLFIAPDWPSAEEFVGRLVGE
jgi:hypothetical protein